MGLGWKFFIPITLVLIVGNGLWISVVGPGNWLGTLFA
jgi:NADH:ubiquinone oxidoreductase subunit H